MNKLTKRILASKCEELRIGVDVHARDLVVSLQLGGAKPERARKMDAAILLSLCRTLVEAGVRVDVCQEAGPCGYHLHRKLKQTGANSLVIVPCNMNDGRKQKTDRIDAEALVDRLDRYLRGNTKAFSVVKVPSEEQEQAREVGRLRNQLKGSRHQWEARGRSLLLAQGHHVSGQWWSARRWAELSKALAPWLIAELEIMRSVIASIDTELKVRDALLEASAPKQLPKAIGALTWALLAREICDWKRFKNRRQVASITGLCPSGYQSGATKHDGHINRRGNPRIRHLLVELVWRLVRWQPDYPPVRKLVEGVAKGSAKRKLAVAAARKLAIDLWRLATGQSTPAKLHLIVPV